MKRSAIVGIEGVCLIGDQVARSRMAIQDGRVKLGSSADVSWHLAPDEILIPAFHDHHTHLIGTYRPPQGPLLDEARGRQECIDLTARWLRENPGTSPVIGEGWDESAWDDRRPPTREEIDTVSGDRPVALRRVCGHMAVVNSIAWAMIQPEGAESEPATGTLTESLALGLSSRWPPTPGDLIEGARAGQREAARRGVVAIDEMARIAQWLAFSRLEASGDLWLRVDHAFPLDSADAVISAGIAPGGRGPLRAVALKGFLDGSFGARTAAIAGVYADRETSGVLLWEESRLIEAARSGAGAGFAICLHAIGARAIAQAILVLERIAPPAGGRAHRIEHAEDLDAGMIARAQRAGIAFSMQPNFTARWQQPGGMYEAALGRERALGLNPYRRVAEGARLLLGSDTMPFGPLVGLPGAIAHPDPAQRLQAGPAITAYADGPIAQGARADLVVLRVPGGDLASSLVQGSAEVLWTAAAGRTVWSHPDAGIPEAFLGAST